MDGAILFQFSQIISVNRKQIDIKIFKMIKSRNKVFASVVLIPCVIWYYNVSHSTIGGITYIYTKKQWFYDLIVVGGDATARNFFPIMITGNT